MTPRFTVEKFTELFPYMKYSSWKPSKKYKNGVEIQLRDGARMLFIYNNDKHYALATIGFFK